MPSVKKLGERLEELMRTMPPRDSSGGAALKIGDRVMVIKARDDILFLDRSDLFGCCGTIVAMPKDWGWTISDLLLVQFPGRQDLFRFPGISESPDCCWIIRTAVMLMEYGDAADQQRRSKLFARYGARETEID